MTGNSNAVAVPPPASANAQISDAGIDTRIFVFKAIVASAMLVGMVLSKHLWFPSPSRTFPTVPLFDGLPSIPVWLGQVWFAAMIGLLGTIAIVPQARYFLVAFAMLAIALALWDQTRWQPWFYQYLFLLLCMCFLPGHGTGNHTRRREGVLNACRIVVAGTYIWSGIQKFNFSFATSIFPWLIDPIVPPDARQFAQNGALLIPILETAMGIGLLIPSFRNLAMLLSLGMHATILYCLGPRGHNWNTIVWPWNVAMAAMAIALFWSTSALRLLSIVWPGRSLMQWMALILFGVMPAFSFYGKWDQYLSAALYSGNLIESQITVSSYGYEEMPPEIRGRLVENFDSRYELDTVNWCFEELNVPPYPAERVYRKIARHVASHTDPTDVVLVIRQPPHWLTGQRIEFPWRVDQLEK